MKKSWHLSCLSIKLLLSLSCSRTNLEQQLLTAESLWEKKQYQAADIEFQRVYRRSTDQKTALFALYRSAMTEGFFLNQQQSALKKYFDIAKTAQDEELKTAALHQAGEILFSSQENYAEALRVYQSLTERSSSCLSFYWYRISRCHFFLHAYVLSLDALKNVKKQSIPKIDSSYRLVVPDEDWEKKALYDKGLIYFVATEEKSTSAQKLCAIKKNCFSLALSCFQGFLKKYQDEPDPQELLPLSSFYIASIFEETDELEKARQIYESLQKKKQLSSFLLESKLNHLYERVQKKQ